MGSECDLLNEHSERDWHAEAQAVTFCHGLVNKEAEMHKSAHINVIGSILVGVAILMGAPAWAADSNASPTVSLPQAVHFMDAKGQDLVVGPGSYRVDAEGTNRIRLLPVETGETVVIDAVSFTHQETVERPVPVTVPDPEQPDVLHLALLSPDGTGLDAIGTYSGVKPRAVTNMTIVTSQIGLAYTAMTTSKLAVVSGLTATTTGTMAPPPPAVKFYPGEFAIRTQKGYYLTAINGGGRATDPVVVTSATSAGPWAKFRLSVTHPNTPYDKSIQTAGGNYLTAVGGGGRTTDVLHTDATQAKDWERFGLAELKFSWSHYFVYGIRTIRGNYLTAIGAGGRGKGTDAIHTDATTINDWEKFGIVKCGDPGSGYVYGIKVADRDILTVHPNPSGPVKGFDQYTFKLLRQGDGSYALLTHNGVNYLTALGGGGQVQKDLSDCHFPNNLFNPCIGKRSEIFHADATQVKAWEKFRVIDQGNCTYAIQTSSGFYVGLFKDSNGTSLWTTRRDGPSTANEKFQLFVIGLASPTVIQ
jgi:hypothetical protein